MNCGIKKNGFILSYRPNLERVKLMLTSTHISTCKKFSHEQYALCSPTYHIHIDDIGLGDIFDAISVNDHHHYHYRWEYKTSFGIISPVKAILCLISSSEIPPLNSRQSKVLGYIQIIGKSSNLCVGFIPNKNRRSFNSIK